MDAHHLPEGKKNRWWTECLGVPQRFWSILIWQHHGVATDLSAAYPWCRSLISPPPTSALWDWDLLTVGVIWAKWTNCHVQETTSRWFKLCAAVCYPAGSIHRKLDNNNTQADSSVTMNKCIWALFPLLALCLLCLINKEQLLTICIRCVDCQCGATLYLHNNGQSSLCPFTVSLGKA